jgi:hypothetical protein
MKKEHIVDEPGAGFLSSKSGIYQMKKEHIVDEPGEY